MIADHGPDRFLLARADDEEHLSHRGMAREGFNGVSKDSFTADLPELLGYIGPSAASLTSGQYQCCDLVSLPCHRSACSERRIASPERLLAARVLFS